MTQNLPVLSNQSINAPNNFDAVFNLAQGPPAPVFPDGAGHGRFPLPNGFVRARADRRSSGCRPWTPRTSPSSISSPTRCRSRPPTSATTARNAFFGDNPATNANQPSIVGFAQVSRPICGGRSSPATSRTPRASAAPTAGRRASTTSATARRTATTRCRRRRPSASAAATRCSRSTRCSTRANNDGDYYFIDPDVNRGTRELRSAPTRFTFSTVVASCRSAAASGSWRDVSRAVDAFIGGWQFNQNTIIQSGLPFNVSYRNAGRIATPGPNRPEPDRRPRRPADAATVVQRGADRRAGQRLRPAGDRHVRQPRAERAARPGYWRTDASLFKHFTLRATGGSRSGSRR